jgi:formate dehydrogenase subunit beta
VAKKFLKGYRKMARHSLFHVADGDPIHTVRAILRAPLERGILDAFFLPVWDKTTQQPAPSVITAPQELEHSDPFAPIMLCNSAPIAFREVQQNPNRRMGIVLRPCELRTYLSIADEKVSKSENSILISMDCLATFPVNDFDWRLNKAKDRDRLSRTALHFAAQGGLLFSRYRASCQLCEQPFPEKADVHFQLFGIETSKHIVIKTKGEETLIDLGMDSFPAESVPEEILERRARTLDRLLEWRKQSRAYASAHLSPEQKTIAGLIEHLRGCNACRNTIAAHCPIFKLDWLTNMEVDEEFVLQNWLGHCGGCGMCDHTCPEDYPIFITIAYLSRSLEAD